MSEPASPAFKHDTRTCVAAPDDEGARLDVVLGRRVEGLSRRMARKFALEGRVRIDGEVAKASVRVRAGQSLEVRLPQQAHSDLALQVLHEDPELVFVHKAPGLHTVALRPGENNCLSALVSAAYPECSAASEDPLEGGALHRLDRATSGVVAFARTREAWLRGRAAFSNGKVIKDYLARSAMPWPPRLPEGALPTWLDAAAGMDRPVGLIPLPADRDNENIAAADCWRIRAALGPAQARGQVRVRMDGRRATTFVQRIVDLGPPGEAPAGCLVHLQLNTGHRHQARVHMAWAGLPLWGDEVYAGGPGERLGLHAFALDLSSAFDISEPVLDTHDLNSWARLALTAD